MKLVGRIPVEPLDDERLTNIERRIVSGAVAQPVRAPRRWLGLAAAATAACAAGAIGWTLHRSEPMLVETSAPVAVHTEERRSVLDIGDATIDASEATAFVVTRPGGGVLVEMSRGRVELEVGKRHGRPPLVVRAGDTDVIVVGTHFSVDFHDGTGDCDVQVTEGVVRVVRKQKEVRVAKGEAWHARDGQVVAALDTIGAVPPRAAAPVEIDMSKAPDVLHDRVAAVPEGQLPSADKPHATAPHGIQRPEEIARPAHRVTPVETALDLRAEIKQVPLAPPLDVGLDAEESVAKYRTISNTSHRDEASHALYSLAVVQHTKLGRNADALATLDVYMRRFEGASDYAAALWLRVRISCLRAIDAQCHQAAYTYINKVPDGDARHVAQVLTTAE